MATQNQPATQLATSPRGPSLLVAFGDRHGIDPGRVIGVISNTVFYQGQKEPPLSPEEIQAALVVTNQYNLNPFTKEIYAFRSKGKLLITVSVDGWSTIVNRQPQLNGIEFEEHFDDKGFIRAVTCKIFRKDRALPVVVTEYTHECRRDTDPWRNMPIRMTRNRAFVQCARIAFSISGIIDEDEAEGAFGPILDARQQSAEEQEAEKIMGELNWMPDRRRKFYETYSARVNEGLAYLRAEQEKAQKRAPKAQGRAQAHQPQQQAATTIQAEQQQAQPEAAEQQQEETTTTEAPAQEQQPTGNNNGAQQEEWKF